MAQVWLVNDLQDKRVWLVNANSDDQAIEKVGGHPHEPLGDPAENRGDEQRWTAENVGQITTQVEITGMLVD